MWHYAWPILLLILSNVLYQVMAKSVPGEVNAFFMASISYAVCAVITFALFWFTSDRQFAPNAKLLNWACFVLPVILIGLDLSTIFMYRAGWNLSAGSTVANIALAVALVFLGALFFNEKITLRQVLGVGLCVGGLALINK
ncbi:MAG: DMT family transporter [Christensenellaceae bacterium]|jgi:drug/metabolite transporter (DMT)-like permease|nr:DMT family transporter [Christensenellaceae bacterium]